MFVRKCLKEVIKQVPQFCKQVDLDEKRSKRTLLDPLLVQEMILPLYAMQELLCYVLRHLWMF